MRALLIGGNVGLVLAAVLGVVAGGAGLLRAFADEQAEARVSLAGSSALHIVEREAGRIGDAARLLGDRPTLARLAAARDARGLADFLERFRRTDRLSGCAVSVDGTVLAQAPTGLPWDEIVRAARPSGDPFLLRTSGRDPLILGASSPVPAVPGVAAIAALALDDAFASSVAQQIGLPVLIRERDVALRGAGTQDPRAPSRARALDSEALVAERIEEAGAYVAVLPLRSPSGEIVGIVETSLSATGIASSLGQLVRSLLGLSAVVAGAAGLFSVLLGRRLVRPIEALTEASSRIGRGDLATPISRSYPAEIGTLAESMDEMRGRLLELTTALRRGRAQAEAILGGIVEGVFAVDRERRIQYANPQAAAMLGLPSEAILGRFCGDVLRPRARGGARPCEDGCPIIHARFRGSTRATEHLSLAGGGTRTVVITSAPPEAGDPAEPTDASREAEGALQYQVIRDETDLEATRRLRDAVLANISHEFRTPLTAQLASIELLRDRLPELESVEIRGLVLSLERGALRLTQLIDNLLESVRIDSGKDSIRRRPVTLDEVIEEAVDLTAPLTTLRGQMLEVDLPYPLPSISGDAPRLVQVFVNLLANANKFAPAGSAIRVGGTVGEGEVSLWVEDEGPGLPSWTVAPRFERFSRAAGDEPEESGMGLGLWIVKSIVERHGGRVEVRSGAGADGSAKGTRMCVILPMGSGDEDPGR